VAYLSGTGIYQDRTQFPLPTVMLLDLNMPRMDGFEVLAWLQARPAFKRLMVIVLSASHQPADVAQAYDLGAKGYLVKPGKLDDLITLLGCLDQWLGYNQFAPLNANPAESGGGACRPETLTTCWL
jgi:CheY-like chemotaxis protein